MATTWIVAADAARARILQVADQERLLEIEDLVNPDARLQDRDLETDARGRFPGGNTWEPEVGAVEHANELFAKRVADYLESARTAQRYDRLVLVAPPKMLGQMRNKLGAEVGKLVVDELDKDLSRLGSAELGEHLRKTRALGPGA